MKKADSDSEVLLERQLAVALKSEPEVWTPDCLAPEQIIALAEKTTPEATAVSHMMHVALCARCRREYAETVELLELAEEMGTLQPQPMPPAMENALASAPFSTEKAVPESTGREAPRRSFWQRWLSPGFGFALGAAAASLLILAVWSESAQRASDRHRHRQIALLAERDTQRKRADQIEQEKRTLEQKLAEANQRPGTDSRLAEEVKRLSTQVASQRVQVARLTDAEIALGQMPLPTPDWVRSRELRQVRGSGTDSQPPQIALVSPVDVALEAPQPILECRPVPGATDYQIHLDAEDPNEEVATPRPLSATRWQINAPLSPGKVYQWEIIASQGGRQIRSRTARFYLLSSAEKETVTAAEQKFARRPLALGMVYVRLGMWDRAEQQLQMALKTNPNQPAVRHLLQEIANKRREN